MLSMGYVVIFLVLGLILISKYFTARKSAARRKSFSDIPGPVGFPIVGNVGDFFNNDVGVWKTARARAIKYYPIYKLQIFNKRFVSILDPEDIETVLCRNIYKISKGVMYSTIKKTIGKGLVVLEGKVWQIRRKLLTKCFHFNTLTNYMGTFNKQANLVISKLQEPVSRPVDIVNYLSHMTLRVISETIFGEHFKVSDADTESYRKSVSRVTKMIGNQSLSPFNLFKKENTDDPVRTIRNFSSKGVDENLKTENIENVENCTKMIDVLRNYPNVFDNDDIVHEVSTFMFAGYDTTAVAISYSLLALANYPEYQEELYQEILEVVGENNVASLAELQSMNFLDRFVKESLRMFPPITFIARQLTEELVLKSDHTLSVDTIVMILIYDIHHNPNLYPNPEKFDPDRFLPDNIQKRHPFAFLPFGAGQRNCIAQKFALLEMKNIIYKILQKFKLEAVDLIKDLVFVPDLVLRSKNGVKVKFVPRKQLKN